MSILQLLYILWSRKFVIIICTVVATLVAAGVTEMLPKSYRASAILHFNAAEIDPVTGEPSFGSRGLNAMMIGEAAIITSRRTAFQVIENLDLLENRQLRDDFLSSTGGRGEFRVWLADTLTENVSVERQQHTGMMGVVYTASDPIVAYNLANAFADAYIDVSLQLRVEPADQTARWAEGQLDELRRKLEEAQQALAEYEEENDLIFNNQRLTLDATELETLTQQLLGARQSRLEADARVNQLELAEEQGDLSVIPFIQTDPVVSGLRTALSEARLTLIEVAERRGENHPDYRNAKARLDGLVAQIDDEMQSVAERLRSEAELARIREADLLAALEAQQQRVIDRKRFVDQVEILRRQVEVRRNALDAVFARLSQSQLSSRVSDAVASVMTRATPPLRSSFPNRRLNIAVGFAGGFGIGLVLAFLLELLDRRMRMSNDSETAGEVPVMATIGSFRPALRQARRELLSGPDDRGGGNDRGKGSGRNTLPGMPEAAE